MLPKDTFACDFFAAFLARVRLQVVHGFLVTRNVGLAVEKFGANFTLVRQGTARMQERVLAIGFATLEGFPAFAALDFFAGARAIVDVETGGGCKAQRAKLTAVRLDVSVDIFVTL